MNVGDLVKLRLNDHTVWAALDGVGVILDILEDEDGFYDYEVIFGSEINWFRDLELELADEDR